MPGALNDPARVPAAPHISTYCQNPLWLKRYVPKRALHLLWWLALRHSSPGLFSTVIALDRGCANSKSSARSGPANLGRPNRTIRCMRELERRRRVRVEHARDDTQSTHLDGAPAVRRARKGSHGCGLVAVVSGRVRSPFGAQCPIVHSIAVLLATHGAHQLRPERRATVRRKPALCTTSHRALFSVRKAAPTPGGPIRQHRRAVETKRSSILPP
ncbi:uncharacterized protein BXZ73DRAFT_77817 [Epithele typhae]|uniref:uncharacterized protein n=1 Tax=Epithele typhae TaxID=378194 RepID=UPI0020079182|nr:uncharacterized protein BXZ73DRAFT_77817 [Epithele typhae]KAH9931136.1 hypothetical protein BXZ73DRAFT_77817 [Epithele typhae]